MKKNKVKYTVLSTGHEVKHVCYLPTIREFNILRLTEGAEIKCNKCGLVWTWKNGSWKNTSIVQRANVI